MRPEPVLVTGATGYVGGRGRGIEISGMDGCGKREG